MRKTTTIQAAVLAVAALCATAKATAQTKEPAPMQAVRVAAGQIVPMDASLSAPVWQTAPVYAEFTENQPNRGQPAPYKTEVRVLYDDKALYFGITAHDPRPAELRTALVRHDQVFRTQDFLVLYIDAVGRKKSAQFYRINAQGITGDGLHTADNDQEDFSPDHDFEAVATPTAQGYNALFKIPYASLRFSPGSALPWRVMLGRRIPREQVRLDLSVPLPREATNFIANMQALQGFTPPASNSFLQLRPTLTARRTSDDAGNPSMPAQTASQFKLSLDTKYQANAQWTLDAALNPDFSQVALDVPQLSRNARFALFSQEKRPVFLESRDLLSSPTDALYTRAIHDPRWVMRASYRGDSTSGTALAANDKGGGLTLLPGTYGSGATTSLASTGVMARIKHDDSGYSLGALAASKQYANGAGYNAAAAVDWTVDLPNNWRTIGQVSLSDTTAQPDAVTGNLRAQTAQRGHHLRLEVNRSLPNWFALAKVEALSPEFRNDAGFVNQNGVRQLEAQLRYKTQNVSFVGLKANQFEPFLQFNHTADASNAASRGDTVSGFLTPGLWMETAHGFDMDLQLRALSLTRSDANAPLLHERYAHVWSSVLPGKPYLSLVEWYADAGQLADYAANRTRPGLKWGVYARTRPHPRLELEPRIDQLRLNGSGNGSANLALNETALRLLAVWHLAPRHSIRGIAQSSSFERGADAAAKLTANNFRSTAQSLTYIWRHSNAQALYAGYNRGNTSGLARFPSKGNEVFVKAQFEI